MRLLDIGANRGDAVQRGLLLGYDVVAVEAAPKVFRELYGNFRLNRSVKCLNLAVSDVDYQRVRFYECVEDGLSTLSVGWLTADGMPYKGKEYREVDVVTITVDSLCRIYGTPDLIKVDVEGAEWGVFKGMTQRWATMCFEWTDVTISEHQEQLAYLRGLGYRYVGPQYIEQHLEAPKEWYPIDGFDILEWTKKTSGHWTQVGWRASGLRPTADVGMMWVS